MAATSKTSSSPLLLLLIFSYLLAFALCRPGRLEEGRAMTPRSINRPLNKEAAAAEAAVTGRRRAMIGSTAPICTYNECRGCRFKCSAEQVPVDASDPMNSAYRYRCVCHR